MSIYKHIHHIIPRHMGGDDDPSNLIELTIEEHAEAHRKLFEEHGHWEDELAWKGLSGLIGKEEVLRLMYNNPERRKQISERMKGNTYGKGKPMSEEQKNKLRGPKSEKHKLALRKPKSNTQKMGRYKRSKSQIENFQKMIKEKFEDPEFKLNHSQKMKERSKCPRCGFESNRSNTTNHINKVCRVNPSIP